ncbi:uncharacterized protein LOC130498710 [Raphanus sativus]|uniref:Uncharacterized protein LOC130498710 n=1 Tax=Raphanus sativus TaxID=3726 RepID=A0A9W3C9V0_RAPSA|nr:uncharacterized protein LOC130498710 [Raphanus sativus]
MVMKAEESCLISMTIPKISLTCMSPLIARMSVSLSDKHRSFGSPRFPAESRADRRANASAISGELILSCVAVSWVIHEPFESVRIQAKPALFVLTSQAASDLQVMSRGSSTVSCNRLLGFVFEDQLVPCDPDYPADPWEYRSCYPRWR